MTLPCCDLENEPDVTGQRWLRMNYDSIVPLRLGHVRLVSRVQRS